MTDRWVTAELVTDSNSQIDGCSYSNSQIDDYAIGRPVALMFCNDGNEPFVNPSGLRLLVPRRVSALRLLVKTLASLKSSLLDLLGLQISSP